MEGGRGGGERKEEGEEEKNALKSLSDGRQIWVLILYLATQ